MKHLKYIPLVAALISAGCGSSEGTKAGESLQGDFSANLPLGVPLMLGAKLTGGSGVATNQPNATAILSSTQDADEVYDLYAAAVEQVGYTIQQETEVDDTRLIVANKGKIRGMITITPRGEQTNIVIAMNGEGL